MRSDAEFRAGGRRVNFGSAKGIVYGMDAEAGCGLVRWCMDTRSGQGGTCDARASASGACLDVAVAPCCEALIDDAAPPGL